MATRTELLEEYSRLGGSETPAGRKFADQRLLKVDKGPKPTIQAWEPSWWDRLKTSMHEPEPLSGVREQGPFGELKEQVTSVFIPSEPTRLTEKISAHPGGAAFLRALPTTTRFAGPETAEMLKPRDVSWYKKWPELLGWATELGMEAALLQPVFKGVGLTKLLGKAGQKLPKVLGLSHHTLVKMAHRAPMSTQFLGIWSGLRSAVATGKPTDIAKSYFSGVGVAIAFLGIGAGVDVTKAKVLQQLALKGKWLERDFGKHFGYLSKKTKKGMINAVRDHQTLVKYSDGNPSQAQVNGWFKRHQSSINDAFGEIIDYQSKHTIGGRVIITPTAKAKPTAQVRPDVAPLVKPLAKPITPAKAPVRPKWLENALSNQKLAKQTNELVVAEGSKADLNRLLKGGYAVEKLLDDGSGAGVVLTEKGLNVLPKDSAFAEFKPPATAPEAVAKPPVKEAIKPTTKQLARAHSLESRLKIPKDVAKKMKLDITGVDSMAKMTPEQANQYLTNLIEQSGKNIPSEPSESTPKKVDLSVRPPRELKEPGIFSFATPKWMLQRLMGTEFLTMDAEAAKLAQELEGQDLSAWTRSIEKQLKRQASLGDRVAAKIVKRPTKPVSQMRDLLDSYEWAPDFLDKKSARIFDEIRLLTKYMRTRANIARIKQGLKPIEEVKEYIPHWLDGVARDIVDKKYPLQFGYPYRLMRGLPKNITNPTAMQRKVKDQLQKYFSKDLGKLLRTMIRYDLRDIYTLRPYQQAWEKLDALKKSGEISKATAEEVAHYLEFDILGHKTLTDLKFDTTFDSFSDFLNKFVLPYNHAIHSMSTALSRSFRTVAHTSAMGLRPRPITRNPFQRLLLLDEYRVRDYAKAQFWKRPTVEHPESKEPINLMELVRQQDWYKSAMQMYEEVSMSMRGLSKAALTPYHKTHIGWDFLSNVEVSAVTGYHDWLYRYNLSQNPKSWYYKKAQKMAARLAIDEGKQVLKDRGKKPSKKFTEAYAKRHQPNVLKELLTKKEDMLPDIRDAVRLTQWEYFPTSSPTIFRGQLSRAMLIYQQWWMNYFFSHMRDNLHRFFTGRTMPRGEQKYGRVIPPMGRFRALKGIGTMVALSKIAATVFGVKTIGYMIFPAPGYLPPIPEFISGVAQYIGADNDKERKKAIGRMKNIWRLGVPLGLAAKDFGKFLRGEWGLKEFLFYTEKPEEPRTLVGEVQ